MLIFPNGMDMTYLDVSDFFEDIDGKFDNLIGDGNVRSEEHTSELQSP